MLRPRGSQTTTHANFLAALARFPHPPTAQVLNLQLDNSHRHPEGTVLLSSPDPGARNFLARPAPCLSPSSLDFSRRPPLRVLKRTGFLRPKATETAWGTRVVRELLEMERETGPTDVLLVEQSYREHWTNEDVANQFAPVPGWPARPFDWLDNGDTWKTYANAIADSLGVFASIHWRMETLPSDAIPACGSSLVNTLLRLQAQHPSLRTVYLLMDYPIDALAEEMAGPNAHEGHASSEHAKRALANSDTFHKITDAHHAAMRDFLAELGTRAPQLRWTTLRQSQHSVPFPDVVTSELASLTAVGDGNSAGGGERLGLDSIDRSLLGIVDKLVASRAHLFVSSDFRNQETACGRVSSFQKQIVALREKGRAEEAKAQGGQDGGSEEGRLWNTGITWSRAD